MSRLHRVLIIGTGSIGERHLRCVLATGRADVSFIEQNLSLADTIAGRYPQARRHNDLDAAISAGIDAAVIATPAPSHISLATRLAQSRIHLLIEKPLSVAPDGIEELKQTVQESGIVAAVAYVYRANPVLAEMRQAITDGRIGRPLEVVAVCGQHFPTYRPAYQQTYYASHATGGGAVQDALTHLINAAEWLVGPIESLVSDLAHQALETRDVEDTVHVLARHGEVMASYSLNQHQSPNELTLTVIGRNGTARFESHRNRWREMQSPDAPWIDHNGESLARDDLFTRQANHFLSAIEGKTRPACTLDEAEATLRVNLAILKSASQRTWLTLAQDT